MTALCTGEAETIAVAKVVVKGKYYRVILWFALQTTPLPGLQNPEKVDFAAFHQLITQQQWTEGRPQQQWPIQNYVYLVFEMVFCLFEIDGQSLDSLGAGGQNFALWAQLNKFQQFQEQILPVLPKVPISSLVLLKEWPNVVLVARTVKRKTIRAKPTRIDGPVTRS